MFMAVILHVTVMCVCVRATFQCCCSDHKLCLVYCFSGNCLMQRTVRVNCLGESYF